MGLLERWQSSLEGFIRGDVFGNSMPAVSVFGPGVSTEAGSPVSADTTRGLPTSGACVELIAGTVAALPVRVMLGNGQEVQSPVIGGMASTDQTWAELVHHLVADALLYGNGLASVERDELGRVTALHPIPRSQCAVEVEVERDVLGKVIDRVYRLSWGTSSANNYRNPLPGTTVVGGENILDVRGPGFDGVESPGCITVFRQQLGQAISAERYGGRFYTGFLGTTAITFPEAIEEEDMKRLRYEFTQRHHGINRSHSTVLLDRNAKIMQLESSAREMQLIETRKYLVEAIAKMFGVPLGLLAYTSNSGVPVEPSERDMIAFSELTVAPWARRVEDAVRRAFSADNIGAIEMERSRIVVADLRTRAAAAKMYAESGILSVNELRNIEDLAPLSDSVADDPIAYVREFGRNVGGQEMGHEDTLPDAETGSPIADSSPEERP